MSIVHAAPTAYTMAREAGDVSGITQSKLQDLMSHRGALKPCPGCGSPRWLLLENPDGTPVIIMHSEELGINGTVPITVLVCSNCGYLRQHATKFLEGFLLDPHVEDGPDEPTG